MQSCLKSSNRKEVYMKSYQLIVRIPEIHCVGCLNRIKNALISHGANHVDIDLSTHIGKVNFEGEEIDSQGYIDSIDNTGYSVELLTIISLD
ncbi:MAG: hypothetical protein CVV57_06100 [Tenericutes bacterium HGW-Tenericutes-2]|nr:MAG: hypothetical protein CVV57_06100 [Tenericutes bacterium HGW-Tenericutes-2]